ncbi:L-rhamnose mutarotase [Oceaniglobus trochenteri]|uniref:L-rhamnose mutarotase n=1 Tax=Oceaniglobus trochenteri TaxID=2763260 RepID=UPI001D00146B|nr:L-rhamnose mutarotase [Oceaniglobus trochenteri]
MTRRAWIMTLKPGCAAEYKARHDAIWPEMLDQMRKAGVSRFTIHRHGLTLFAVQDRDGPAPGEPDPVMWKWWAHMAPLMEVHPDTRPIQTDLETMFDFNASS